MSNKVYSENATMTALIQEEINKVLEEAAVALEKSAMSELQDLPTSSVVGGASDRQFWIGRVAGKQSAARIVRSMKEIP
jgi:hypothetical protein